MREEELGALRERGRAPGGEGGLRGLDGASTSSTDAKSTAPVCARRRVVDGAAAAGRAVDSAPADPVRNPGRAGRVDGFGHAE